MLKAVAEKIYTVEEYLELEKVSEVRHEYYYGKLITMPGESKTANKIANNILAEWRKPLLDKSFECYTNDVKTEIQKNGIFRYPDIVVASDTDDDDSYIVKQPVIMVEVASEESWKRDTMTKRKEYTALPSLKHYLIVSQEEIYVELHSRKGDESLEDALDLPDFDLKITLSDIYHRVKFADAKTDQ